MAPPDQASPSPPSRQTQPFQLQLFTLFLIVTIAAFVCAFYLVMGRLAGWSLDDQRWMMQVGVRGPLLLVWIVGIGLAAQYYPVEPRRATFALLGFAGLLTTATVTHGAQLWLIEWISSTSGPPAIDATRYLSVIGMASVLLNCACWILLMFAIFGQRPVGPLRGRVD